jgi:hypothetical protein
LRWALVIRYSDPDFEVSARCFWPPLTNGSGSCSFRQWPSRRQQFLSCFAYYFLKGHLHHSSRIKIHEEVTKQ